MQFVRGCSKFVFVSSATDLEQHVVSQCQPGARTLRNTCGARWSRFPRNVRVATAASPRLERVSTVSTEYPRGGRGVAAARPRNVRTAKVRRPFFGRADSLFSRRQRTPARPFFGGSAEPPTATDRRRCRASKSRRRRYSRRLAPKSRGPTGRAGSDWRYRDSRLIRTRLRSETRRRELVEERRARRPRPKGATGAREMCRKEGNVQRDVAPRRWFTPSRRPASRPAKRRRRSGAGAPGPLDKDPCAPRRRRG